MTKFERTLRFLILAIFGAQVTLTLTDLFLTLENRLKIIRDENNYSIQSEFDNIPLDCS